MSLGRDLSMQSFLHLSSQPYPEIIQWLARKAGQQLPGKCVLPAPPGPVPEPDYGCFSPKALLVLFLSNCTCSDSAPRLPAAAPAHSTGVPKLLLQPSCKGDQGLLAQETDAVMVTSSLPFSPQLSGTVWCAQKLSSSPVLLFTAMALLISNHPLLLNEITQNCTIIGDVICLPKILPPLGIRSSISVTSQTLKCREMIISPDSGPTGFSEDGSSARTIMAPTDGPTLNGRVLQISVSVWWDWWFQHQVQQCGKLWFPSLHSCTAKLLYSNCQAFKAGWLHFKNK